MFPVFQTLYLALFCATKLGIRSRNCSKILHEMIIRCRIYTNLIFIENFQLKLRRSRIQIFKIKTENCENVVNSTLFSHVFLTLTTTLLLLKSISRKEIPFFALAALHSTKSFHKKRVLLTVKIVFLIIPLCL